jgi:hypothetical protein
MLSAYLMNTFLIQLRESLPNLCLLALFQLPPTLTAKTNLTLQLFHLLITNQSLDPILLAKLRGQPKRVARQIIIAVTQNLSFSVFLQEFFPTLDNITIVLTKLTGSHFIIRTIFSKTVSSCVRNA